MMLSKGMKKLAREAIVSIIVLLLSAVSAHATVYQYSFNAGCDGGKHTSIGGYVYYKGGITKLKKGCFLQYIYAGADDQIDPPSQTGGTSDDDFLLITGEVGNDFLNAATFEGEFYYTCYSTVDGDSSPKIYVRAWSTLESYIISGAYYGNSILFSPNVADEFSPPPTPNDVGLTTFETSNDRNPPGPPINFKATQEASGDLILSWTPTNEPDVTATVIRYKLISPAPTNESDGNPLTVVSTFAANQSFRHTGLTHMQRYYYSAFSRDSASNYSVPATTNEVSNDTLPPAVISTDPTNTDTSVQTSKNITVTFNDNMSKDATQSSFSIYPVVSGATFSWPQDNQMRINTGGLLSTATTYTCTVSASAKDDAGHTMVSAYTWWFKTLLGYPPQITDIKVGGWKAYPGDVISAQPKITAHIIDPESWPTTAGIVAIELTADGFNTIYSTTELVSPLFDQTTGNLDCRPFALPAGIYTITLEAWDSDGNSTREVVEGLLVRSGAVKLETPVYCYPNPFESGVGTVISYTLSVDSDVIIFVFSIKGSAIFKVKIPAGTTGGTAGYNEYFWDGRSNFGDTIGKGIYIIKIAANGQSIGSTKIMVK